MAVFILIFGMVALLIYNFLRRTLAGFQTGLDRLTISARLSEAVNSELNLSGRDIESVSFSPGRFVQTTRAILDNNWRLRVIPSPVASLTFLSASGCDIENLPEDLFHHQLKTVRLSRNRRLKSIPNLGRNAIGNGADLSSIA